MRLDGFVTQAQSSTPIELVLNTDFDSWLPQQPAPIQQWIEAQQFHQIKHQHLLLPNAQGQLDKVVKFYCEQQSPLERLASLPMHLPEGIYHLQGACDEALLWGWALGAYQFTRYKKAARMPAQLLIEGQHEEFLHGIEAVYSVRDWINTPADDLGPEQLAAVAESLAKQHGADYRVIIGEQLLEENFPSIYAMGRASHRAPRLIEINWGDPKAPRLALVGKGVCFDTGGLNIKPDSGMRIMKKDMGGAAHVLALAGWIMAQKLPLRLQVLVPAIENSVAANAIRPGDIVRMRNGLTVEIDNTDAEGRMVLADPLTYASESKPQLLIDFSTLTGAARVALGPEVGAFFCNDDAVAAQFYQCSQETADAVWRLPLHRAYLYDLESSVADYKNSGSGNAGAIIAALFMEQFVLNNPPWIHIDTTAWNLRSRPGHPIGGEAIGIRAMYALIKQRFL